MKPPFVDYNFFLTVNKTIIRSDDITSSIDSEAMVTLTKSRDSTILEEFMGKIISVYNGKTYVRVKVRPKMIGYKLGVYSYTKKMGKSIHNSDKNAKKKAKMRRKITAKKIRKTTVKKAKKTLAPVKVKGGKRKR